MGLSLKNAFKKGRSDVFPQNRHIKAGGNVSVAHAKIVDYHRLVPCFIEHDLASDVARAAGNQDSV
jgi:hypothetical protein